MSITAEVAPPSTRDWGRILRRALVALTMVTIALAIGGRIWISYYQPVRNGSSMGTFGMPRLYHAYTASGRNISGVIEGAVFQYQPGQLWVTMTLANDGPFAVRVENIGKIMGSTETRVGPLFGEESNRLGTRPESFEAFQPFTLRPDQERFVAWGLSFQGCGPNKDRGSGVSESDQVWAEISFMGFKRTAEIELMQPIKFLYPGLCGGSNARVDP